MSDPTDIIVETVTWEAYQSEIEHIRSTVFIVEQGIPESLEWDEFEQSSWHFLARCQGELAGTGRLQTDGKITRIAVLKPWRHRGVATAIVQKILHTAAVQNLNALYLNAQTTATGLYQPFGFEQSGDVFDEGGIEHIRMVRQ